ncbi:hypothetical protein JCM19376_39520 [Fusibacter bizertensis]
MVKYLESHGVIFQYETTVTNVLFDVQPDKKVARRIDYTSHHVNNHIGLSENDLVIMTLGSNTDQSGFGDDNHPAVVLEGLGSS